MRLVRWMTMTGFSLILVAPAPRGASAEDAMPPGPATTSESSGVVRPRIEVDQPEQSAGDVKPGRRLYYSFAIRNTGQMPLQIEKVKPDCGCVVAEFDATIPVGGVGRVRATLNTAGRKGDLEKHLRVTCNDPEQPTILLTMTARIFQPVEVLPCEELLMPLTQGRAARTDVVVRGNDATPFVIEKAESSHPSLQVRIVRPVKPLSETPKMAQQDQRVELVVPKSAPMAAFDATVTLQTTHPERPTITLRVSAYPQNAVVANPPRLYFGEVSAESLETLTRTITLFRRQGTFKVIAATTTDPALLLKVEPSPDGVYNDIRATYRGGWQPGATGGRITIRTDDPSRPTIEVPYEAVVVH